MHDFVPEEGNPTEVDVGPLTQDFIDNVFKSANGMATDAFNRCLFQRCEYDRSRWAFGLSPKTLETGGKAIEFFIDVSNGHWDPELESDQEFKFDRNGRLCEIHGFCAGNTIEFHDSEIVGDVKHQDGTDYFEMTLKVGEIGCLSVNTVLGGTSLKIEYKLIDRCGVLGFTPTGISARGILFDNKSVTKILSGDAFVSLDDVLQRIINPWFTSTNILNFTRNEGIAPQLSLDLTTDMIERIIVTHTIT